MIVGSSQLNEKKFINMLLQRQEFYIIYDAGGWF